MASLIFFLQNLLVLFLCSATPSFSFEPLNVEVVALIAVRRSLIDPHGVLNNWDEDSVDPCSWAMITCSSENLVIGLGAPSQSLSGFLSGMIGNLTNLQQVLLQSNNITGEIPQELGLLPKLRTIDLSNNRFSGFVPESIGRLNSLQYLRLNNNSLSGAFPVSLSKIPHLGFLDLSYNNLSGPVPLFPARTFNVVGNPLICGSRSTMECSRTTAPGSLTFLLQSPQENQTARRKAQKLAVALGSSFGAVSLLVLSVGLFFWWRQKQKRRSFVGINERTEDGSPSSTAELGNVRRFGLRELAAATESFSEKNVLGKGGFGVVYKGRLADGTVVAVKRLRDCGASGEAQFRTEVEMISLAVHRNLLRLIGYCSAAGERLLVYPFMPNGSVASRLRGKPALDWDARKRIAVGACRGLVYLHEQCDPKIIHRDVKAANVLLDGGCDAVVGDFGLARLLDHGDSHVTTAVRGTAGHIAPEYLSTGQSSDKTDVFGFGILLLELVSGQRALELVVKGAHHQKGAVLDWVKKLHQERELDILVDRDLGNGYDIVDVSEMVQVALLCTQYLPSNRPRMSEVMRMLEGDGLVEKWEASNRETRCSDNALGGANDGKEDGSNDNDNYGDGFSMEFVEEMELSGPR